MHRLTLVFGNYTTVFCIDGLIVCRNQGDNNDLRTKIVDAYNASKARDHLRYVQTEVGIQIRH